MTKADVENLDEMKRKFLKGVNVIAKIKACSDMATNHRSKGYFNELDKTIREVSEIRKQLKTEDNE